ncbi:MAG TPA: hypothetical protein VFF67_07900 [Thermoplasmata archaeon]|nr:hypothetical protein [Thermoplasmata archaeon]
MVAIAELHGCAAPPPNCLEAYVPPDGTTDARGAYYHLQGYPTVFFDGQHGLIGQEGSTEAYSQNVYWDAIQNASKVPGNVSIAQTVVLSGTTVRAAVGITSGVNGTYNVITYLLEYINKTGVSNGYGPHSIGYVVRATVHNHPMTVTMGQTLGFNATEPLNSTWNRFNLSVLSFVQDNTTKIVQNAYLTPSINWSAQWFPVTFVRSGLPPGTPWSITLNGSKTATTGTQIQYSVHPGTYSFVAEAPGYQSNLSTANPSIGTVAVEGFGTSVSVVFHRVSYQLVFHETGLPTGSGWGVLIGSESQTSFTSNLTYTEPNGTYGYVVLPVAGYVVPSSGLAFINGSDLIVAVGFRPLTYPIVFVEFGLPPGSNWSVTISNLSTGFNLTKSSTSNSLVFFLSNGTYSIGFSLPAGYSGNASSTSITVAGSMVTGPVIHAQAPSPPASPAVRPGNTSVFASLPLLAWLALEVAVAVCIALVVVWVRRRPPKPIGQRR